MSIHIIHFSNKIRALVLSKIYLSMQSWKKILGLKKEFEIAVVNEPLKFYCISCIL